MSTQSKHTTRGHRYPRFSVRGLVVLILIIGGWLGWIVRSTRRQREAVAAIQKAGGEVHFQWEWKKGTFFPGSKPWAPKWIVDVCGVDYFSHVAHVSFATRAQLAVPTKQLLANLWELQRQSAEMDDAQFSRMEAFTQVTDRGLMHLDELPHLSEIDLSSTGVTDAGVKVLKLALPKLLIIR